MWQPAELGRERHPGLFYDEAHRERMRARLGEAPFAAWWATVRGASTHCAPALIWWLTGDEQPAAKARDDLLNTPIWREASHGYLEPSSHRFADYVATYDVLAAWPGLTAEQNQAIRAKIRAEALHYAGVMAGGVPGGCNYGNQRTLAASALGMAAITLAEDPAAAGWLRRALFEIRRDENFWFFRPGGLFVEGLGYTGYMNMQFVPFAIAYERATGRYLFADPRLREWLTFAAYQMQANGELIPWGTCECGVGQRYFALLCSPRYGGDLEPLYRRAFHLAPGAAVDVYSAGIALARYEPGPDDASIPASRAFPESQSVVLRESWGHDAVSVWFAGKDGTWPLHHRYDTYSHADSGHFVLAAWDEILAADSGYDHWVSHDYYGPEFHNVLLIDGHGPAQDTPGTLDDIVTEGEVRHARVTTQYAGCTLRRSLYLARGRYVVVCDEVTADRPHDYRWQVRSACPPGSAGTHQGERDVTWPGLSASGWRNLEPGRTQLTVVVPPFAQLALTPGRWRPMSGKPEFANQVAEATWRGASTTALFILLPNLREQPDVTWEPPGDQELLVRGPGWADRIGIGNGGQASISPAER